jgi:monoamine oxidase
VPRKSRVAIVGGGYARLSCAIELAASGIDACVLEAAALGSGASTRSGGGVNIGKSFTGKVLTRDPEVVKVILASGHDAFSMIETLIEREKIDCSWEKKGRFVHAWTPKDYKFQKSCVANLNADAGSGAYWCPASASASRWRPTTTMAASLWIARPSRIPRFTTRACSMPLAGDLLHGGCEDHHALRQRLAHRHLARRHRG